MLNALFLKNTQYNNYLYRVFTQHFFDSFLSLLSNLCAVDQYIRRSFDANAYLICVFVNVEKFYSNIFSDENLILLLVGFQK